MTTQSDNKYTLFDVLTDNTRIFYELRIFYEFRSIFPSPVGVRRNERDE